VVALGAQHDAQHLGQRRIVIHDEHASSCHVSMVTFQRQFGGALTRWPLSPRARSG
jgi:hypothetical protein